MTNEPHSGQCTIMRDLVNLVSQNRTLTLVLLICHWGPLQIRYGMTECKTIQNESLGNGPLSTNLPISFLIIAVMELCLYEN